MPVNQAGTPGGTPRSKLASGAPNPGLGSRSKRGVAPGAGPAGSPARTPSRRVGPVGGPLTVVNSAVLRVQAGLSINVRCALPAAAVVGDAAAAVVVVGAGAGACFRPSCTPGHVSPLLRGVGCADGCCVSPFRVGYMRVGCFEGAEHHTVFDLSRLCVCNAQFLPLLSPSVRPSTSHITHRTSHIAHRTSHIAH